MTFCRNATATAPARPSGIAAEAVARQRLPPRRTLAAGVLSGIASHLPDAAPGRPAARTHRHTFDTAAYVAAAGQTGLYPPSA